MSSNKVTFEVNISIEVLTWNYIVAFTPNQ